MSAIVRVHIWCEAPALPRESVTLKAWLKPDCRLQYTASRLQEYVKLRAELNMPETVLEPAPDLAAKFRVYRALHQTLPL